MSIVEYQGGYMDTNKKITWEKVKEYCTKYGYIALIVVAMIVLATAIAIGTASSANNEVEETNTTTTSFYNPVMNFTLAKDYSDTELMYNETLNQWEAHKAVDLTVSEGSGVYAVLDGTVTSVEKDYLKGTVITITHDNGLVTTYASLDDEAKVKVNDKVTRGQEIGSATTSAENEKLGARLQFAVFKDGVAVDPNNYLDLGTK